MRSNLAPQRKAQPPILSLLWSGLAIFLWQVCPPWLSLQLNVFDNFPIFHKYQETFKSCIQLQLPIENRTNNKVFRPLNDNMLQQCPMVIL